MWAPEVWDSPSVSLKGKEERKEDEVQHENIHLCSADKITLQLTSYLLSRASALSFQELKQTQQLRKILQIH